MGQSSGRQSMWAGQGTAGGGTRLLGAVPLPVIRLGPLARRGEVIHVIPRQVVDVDLLQGAQDLLHGALELPQVIPGLLQGALELLQMVPGSVHDGWESPQFGSGPRQLSLRAAGVEGIAWHGPVQGVLELLQTYSGPVHKTFSCSVHGVSGGILVKTYESAGGLGGSLVLVTPLEPVCERCVQHSN